MAEKLLKTFVQRKRKTVDPCPVCFLHRERCICAFIPKLDLKTRLSLIIHAKELKRTTNTGRLATQALINSEIHVRGKTTERLDLSSLLMPEYETYVLFPADEALDLETIKPQKPIQLIVTDGNWRQASKLNTRHPELNHVPRVKISGANTAQHHLRKEHFSEGMATLEAIALAFGIIEGKEVGDVLRELYNKKLQATLKGRGILS
ncbi:DTW domain-containing protein [Bdellovibrio bacteriovorus]|uniref:tRNA-uridine aminocarboxypropyltransferase n=1 Tax=Bdellovibrio bacteriovorus TaxID=959 RepID=A0A150WHR5_BDEBC|nr:tRNA-uridine aminocarboxypropyltransferase [Bdellovibrio bacteriovorus]KYG62456.1 DTW domain-containing protein [Bdellovibrio bacteriovorus]